MCPEKGFACVLVYCMFSCIWGRWRQVQLQLQLQSLNRWQGVGVQRASVSLGFSCKVTGVCMGASGIMLLQSLL